VKIGGRGAPASAARDADVCWSESTGSAAAEPLLRFRRREFEPGNGSADVATIFEGLDGGEWRRLCADTRGGFTLLQLAKRDPHLEAQLRARRWRGQAAERYSCERGLLNAIEEDAGTAGHVPSRGDARRKKKMCAFAWKPIWAGISGPPKPRCYNIFYD